MNFQFHLQHNVLESARQKICQFHETLRSELCRSLASTAYSNLSAVADKTAADTIYGIDKIAEKVILSWFDREWPKEWPVELVMEGLEDIAPVTFPQSVSVSQTIFKCIIDPIDGTRELMYDKRPAWILTGLAPQKGDAATLQDIALAVMTELPIRKNALCDQISGIRGCGKQGLIAEMLDIRTGERRRYTPTPYTGNDFIHGFASFGRFLPKALDLLGIIETDFWNALYGEDAIDTLAIFDDQYLSAAGHFYDILTGRKRMVIDLRPLVYKKKGLSNAFTCHPYDVCTAFLLEEAGCVIAKPDGGPLDAPLDTTSPIAWIALANPILAQRIRPALDKILERHCR